MVRKETCPNCKGNRYINIETSKGTNKHAKCPQCDGNGYRVRITLDCTTSERI